MNTTKKEILQLFKNNNIAPAQISHNLIAAKKAANNMILSTNIDKSIDIINLVFFNVPIDGMYTHSYGFHTRQGRAIIETFEELYYNYSN